MEKPKRTRRKRITVSRENKDFVRDKVRPLFFSYAYFHKAVGDKYPELMKTPQDLYRWQNIFGLKCSAKTDEIIAMREMVKDILQRELTELV